MDESLSAFLRTQQKCEQSRADLMYKYRSMKSVLRKISEGDEPLTVLETYLVRSVCAFILSEFAREDIENARLNEF